MAIPSFACYRGLHHSLVHSITHTTTLSDQYLIKRDQLRNRDVEAAGNTKKYQMIARRIAPTWLLQCLLLTGLIASLVGYLGCFSVVQN